MTSNPFAFWLRNLLLVLSSILIFPNSLQVAAIANRPPKPNQIPALLAIGDQSQINQVPPDEFIATPIADELLAQIEEAPPELLAQDLVS